MMILFLDIDGVLLPGRAYQLSGQTKPYATKFDPCVVSMLNALGEEGAKFVIHSSWLNHSIETIQANCENPNLTCLIDHMVDQGLKREYFHENPYAMWKMNSNRWGAVHIWLENNDYKGDYRVLDDEVYSEPIHHEYSIIPSRVVRTNFDEGLSYSQFLQLRYDLRATMRDGPPASATLILP